MRATGFYNDVNLIQEGDQAAGEEGDYEQVAVDSKMIESSPVASFSAAESCKHEGHDEGG